LTLVLGTQVYEGAPDAMARQTRAVEALVALRNVIPLNVQWADAPYEWSGLETIAVLRQDSATVTGLPMRRRKPIMPELFDALADAAAARGCPAFGFLNADIIVSQAAVDLVARENNDGCMFSRMDVDAATGADRGIMLNGLDLFVFAVAWWRRERRRFRPYILGEWFYDPVFAAILMSHGRGTIANRNGDIRHAMHQHAPHGPLSHYNGYLAAIDAAYFSLWAQYRSRLDALRARDASAEEERALQRDVFRWQPSLVKRAVQAGRSAKAWLRYRSLRGEMRRALAAIP